jgi:hypothetical protein
LSFDPEVVEQLDQAIFHLKGHALNEPLRHFGSDGVSIGRANTEMASVLYVSRNQILADQFVGIGPLTGNKSSERYPASCNPCVG